MRRIWWRWIAPLLVGFVALMVIAGTARSDTATGIGLLVVVVALLALNYPRDMFRRSVNQAAHHEPGSSIVVVRRGVRHDEEQGGRESEPQALWQRLSRVLVPLWIATPLMYLGLAFILFQPLSRFLSAWVFYAVLLVLAVFLGFRVASRYEVTVLSRTRDEYIVRTRRRRASTTTEAPTPTPTETTG